jgi:UDP-sugar pyrophosphorylase
VAGGLGERLGYNGIKISLPQYESEREASFIKLYIEHILSLQRSAGEGVQLPLAIMTSDDTHALTVDLLKDNDNFGMAPGQISIMKQNKVISIPHFPERTLERKFRDASFCRSTH